ncbi:MAG: amidase [Polyangiaceae bacterium]|nr:amidase [Polyangiaceae bacterium]
MTLKDHRRGTDRRTFITTSAALGAAFLTGCAGSANPPQVPTGPCAGSSPNSFPAADLEELTISDLQGRLGNRQESSRSLVEKYIARIDAMNAKGPELRAVLELNPDALEIADKLDRERAAKGPRSALHGIPILLKDNIDTADKMTTTAGSLALSGSIPAKDSTVAARLREAGAILLGKTNMSEWANFRSNRSSSGWSSRGGQCRNPYALDRTPIGSSSGSGSAIAANLAAAAIGTETDGSIVCPSYACSLVGIKPTVGLVSRAGIIPISSTQDTAGPMARTVRDAAILLGALVGADSRDSMSAEGVKHGLRDYTQFLGREGTRGLRIGVVREGLFGRNSRIDAVIESALKDLKYLGMEVIDAPELPKMDELEKSEWEVLLYEFKATLNAYLAGLSERTQVKTLTELIAWNDKHRDEVMPYFGQELFIDAEKKGDLTSKEYVDALARCRELSRTKGLDSVLDGQKLDALVAPTGSLPWLIDMLNGDSFGFAASMAPAVAGYPHITVPAGYSAGLPVGISFIGRPWSEPLLLRIAFAYEQATKARRAPRFLPTADVSTPR